MGRKEMGESKGGVMEGGNREGEEGGISEGGREGMQFAVTGHSTAHCKKSFNYQRFPWLQGQGQLIWINCIRQPERKAVQINHHLNSLTSMTCWMYPSSLKSK